MAPVSWCRDSSEHNDILEEQAVRTEDACEIIATTLHSRRRLSSHLAS